MRNFNLKSTLKGVPGKLFPKKSPKKNYWLLSKIALAAILVVSLITFSCRRMSPNSEGGKASAAKESPILQSNTATGDEFTIAVIGDTQYYTTNIGYNGQYIQQLKDQMTWIINNKTSENIKYVISVGDITDDYDHTDATTENEYKRADTAYKMLYNAGIPYGVVPGDHDIAFSSPWYASDFYTTYFGRAKFQGRSYYKDDFPTGQNSNVNHYDFVDIPVVGDSLIVVYLRWWDNMTSAQSAADWARTAIAANPKRKAIIVTHFVVENTDNYTEDTASGTRNSAENNPDGKDDWGLQSSTESYGQAQRIYETLKDLPNFMMMVGGHVKYEGRRRDINAGNTVHSFTSDYQGCVYPPGLLRTMKFSKSKDLISVRTFLPSGGNCVKVTTDPACVNQPFTYDCSKTASTFVVPWLHSFTTSRTNDYDNNATSQSAFFNAGVWTIQGMSNVTFGASGGIAAPGDYDGDGKTDQAVFTQSTGIWQFNISGMANLTFGTGGADIPTPGDFDGNGTTDCAIFRPSTHTFYVHQNYLASNISLIVGSTGDIPVPMDYDGDGKVDFATFTPSTAAWTIPGISTAVYGMNGDIPVPGDYTGQGRNTKAVYRPSDHTWHVNGLTAVTIGQANDIPAPGDYDGDGKTDMAVYRPVDGKIYIYGIATPITTGVLNGKPLNLPYPVRNYFFH